VFYEAGVTSAMVMFIIAAATAMGWVLTTEQVPVKLANAMAPLASNPIVLLLIISVLLLITGCFMELNAAIVILAPILLPLIIKANVDLVHFGIIMVVNMAIGLLTPPLGVNLFVACGLDRKVEFNNLVKAVIPMLLVLIFDLALFTYIPSLTITLPALFK
jgi:C4-dicarboxylate transporter DctM subunit